MKYLIILCAFSGAVLFSSCGKKNYTCVCKGGFSGIGQTFQLNNTTKKDAQNTCNSYNSPGSTVDGYFGCALQ